VVLLEPAQIDDSQKPSWWSEHRASICTYKRSLDPQIPAWIFAAFGDLPVI
jgi:hypothetical protein